MAPPADCNIDDEIAVDSGTEEELVTPYTSEDEFIRSWNHPGKLLADQIEAGDVEAFLAPQPLIRKTTRTRRRSISSCDEFPGSRAEAPAPQDEVGEEARAQRSPGPMAYRVDRGMLRVRTRGLAYRLSPTMEDKAAEEHALWGSIVHGVPVDDEWLEVGGRFLPFRLQGVFVLVPAGRALLPLGTRAAHTGRRGRAAERCVDGLDADESTASPSGRPVSQAVSVIVRLPCGKVVLPAFRLCPGERLDVLRHAAEVALGCGVGLQCRLAHGTQLLKEKHTVEEAGLLDGAEVLAVMEKECIVDDIIPVDSDGEELSTPESSDIDS